MIGGNTTALIQVKNEGEKNAIGERVNQWSDAVGLKGWLDLSSGESKYAPHSAKIQESSHLFICDYQNLNVTSENVRILIDGFVYDIMLIDDPMNLHQQLEIYLKFVGGQNV